MEVKTIREVLSTVSYPGRGIIAGASQDGTHAVAAYWIMGRSASSRNRVFAADGEGIRTKAFDESAVKDPRLIIYSAVKVFGTRTIVTNGDQTDTIYDAFKEGGSFESALRTRTFEDDPPNYTPRISALLDTSRGALRISMSVIKRDAVSNFCTARYIFDYDAPRAGFARYIHTYTGDGDPLPSFEGEPECLSIPGTIEELTDAIWSSLNEENRISLFVRFIDIKTGRTETSLINKYGR